jgi:hypothetical protein
MMKLYWIYVAKKYGDTEWNIWYYVLKGLLHKYWGILVQ